MRYNCMDIRTILESETESEFDWIEFENHLRECQSCRELVALENGVESELRESKRLKAPEGIIANVMRSIYDFEKYKRSSAIITKIQLIVPSVTGLLSIFFVLQNKGIFREIAGYFSFDWSKLWQYLEPNSAINTTIIGEAVKITSSPLFIAAFIGAAFLIGFYTIAAFEKATK